MATSAATPTTGESLFTLGLTPGHTCTPHKRRVTLAWTRMRMAAAAATLPCLADLTDASTFGKKVGAAVSDGVK